MQLLEAADVEIGDGHWSVGYQFDSFGCVLYSAYSDVCTPSRVALSGIAGHPKNDLARNVLTKSLTSNVATLVTDDVGVGFRVGDTVAVAGVDSTFNGSYVITAVNGSSISYALTHANVSSAAATGTASGPDHSEYSGSARDAYVFSVLTSFRGRARCSDGTEPEVVDHALDAETEKASGYALFTGNSGEADVYLESPDVSTVSVGATVADTISAMLQKFWSIATGVSESETLIHLGISNLLDLTSQNLLVDGVLNGTKIKVVTSPGYAADSAAVTGPVKIKLGDKQVISVPDTINNDLNNEAVRLVSIEFDPCMAVRAS